MRRALFVLTIATAPATAAAFEYPTVGGHEGEIDVGARFEGHLGYVEPTPRRSTHQPADIKVFGMSAGVTLGNLGPFLDFYVRLDGGYFIAAAESVARTDDDLPIGTLFHGEDKGGWASATIGSNIVHTPRFAFGAFIQGTVPIDVDLAKFSNVRLHYAGGGTLLGVHITDPAALLRLSNLTRIFVGTGAYAGNDQQNAQGELESLFYLDLSRWILPWRAGLGVGPRFEVDLNEHVDDAYNQAYGAVSPDLVAGDRVRQQRLGGVVRAYVFVTPHASVEAGFDGQLSGEDARATRRYSAGLRVAF
jgi:hypothetical protein